MPTVYQNKIKAHVSTCSQCQPHHYHATFEVWADNVLKGSFSFLDEAESCAFKGMIGPDGRIIHNAKSWPIYVRRCGEMRLIKFSTRG